MSTRAQIAIQTADEAAPKMRTQREGTKQTTLIAMLRAPEGATIEEIGAALQWAPHYADARIMPMQLCKLLFLEGTAAKGLA